MAKWYKHLSEFVQGTVNYERLMNSTKFGISISRQYKKLKSTVKVTSSTSQNVENVAVKLESDCNDKVKTEQDNIHICSDVEEDKTIEFIANINVTKNFCKEDLNTTVDINLEGTGNKMVLNIECEKCHCGAREVKSKTCKGQGDLICGGCRCQ